MESYIDPIVASYLDRFPVAQKTVVQKTDDKILVHLIEAEFTLIRYEPYTLVLEKNHKISKVGYIYQGTLDLLTTDSGGKSLRKGHMGKGDFFGLDVFFDRGRSLYDAFSLEPLECYVIDPERLLMLMEENSQLRACMEGVLIETMKRFFRSPAFSGGTGLFEVTGPKITRFDKSIAYIDSHYMNPLTLDDVARKAGLSRYYFSRMFKKETGHSFKDYLNINRMDAAKKILGLPEMNVSQACYSVGFNDVSYFARIFKRYEGISPSTFRKQVMNGT